MDLCFVRSRIPPRQRLAGGQGRGARGVLALQVGVPREHVARASYAAQQHPDPGRAVDRIRRAAQRQAARVRRNHPAVGQGSAQPDRRGARSGQGRIGIALRRQRADHDRRTRHVPGADVPSDRAGQGHRVPGLGRRLCARADHQRLHPGQTDREEPRRERDQVHRHRIGVGEVLWMRGHRRQSGRRLSFYGRRGHRDRHRREGPPPDLRVLPAGRPRVGQAVRRHRVGPGDQP